LNNTQATYENALDAAFAQRVHDINSAIDATNKLIFQIQNQKLESFLLAKAYGNIALFYMIKGEFSLAIEYANKATGIYRNLGNEVGIADAQFTIASVYYKTDKYYLGLKYLVDCALIYSRHNQYASLSKTYKSIGTIYEFFNDEANAIKTYDRAIENGKLAKNDNLVSNVYNPLSGIYLNRNQIDKANFYIDEAIKLKEATNDVRGLGFSYYGKAKVFAKQGKITEAIQFYHKALAIHVNAQERLGECMVYYKLAYLYFEQNNKEEQIKAALACLKLAQQYNVMYINIKIHYLLYKIFAQQHDTTNALQWLEKHHYYSNIVYERQAQEMSSGYNLIMEKEAQIIKEQHNQEKQEIIVEKDKAVHLAKSKTEFLSLMSHEIRTPLNAVTSIAYLLSEHSNTNHEDAELVTSLQHAANSLVHIVNDILDFAKLESGKMQLNVEPASITAILQNVIGIFKYMAAEKDVQLILDIDKNLFTCYQLDQPKLTRALSNLMSNAIKFTDVGSVTLKASLQNNNTEAQHQVLFEVIDTGIGIAEKYKSSLFDSFTQFADSQTNKIAGTGLGLNITNAIVTLMQGQLQYTTVLQQGTTFKFALQLQKANVIATTNHTNYQLQHLNILVVDDNRLNALVACKILEKWQIKADVSSSGANAIEKCALKKYHLILMDLRMPEMDGFTAAKQIKTYNTINTNTPIYALTADLEIEGENKERPFLAGILRKPIETTKLYNILVETAANVAN
jgi:signal transduction histidine kinase